MYGEWILVLQDYLMVLGFLKAAEVNGFYDSHTSKIVRRFQHSRGMPITGVTDSRTWEELDKAIKERK